MLRSTVKPLNVVLQIRLKNSWLRENANVVCVLVNKHVERVFHLINPSHYYYCTFSVFKEPTKVPKHEVLDKEMKIYPCLQFLMMNSNCRREYLTKATN